MSEKFLPTYVRLHIYGFSSLFFSPPLFSSPFFFLFCLSGSRSRSRSRGRRHRKRSRSRSKSRSRSREKKSSRTSTSTHASSTSSNGQISILPPTAEQQQGPPLVGQPTTGPGIMPPPNQPFPFPPPNGIYIEAKKKKKLENVFSLLLSTFLPYIAHAHTQRMKAKNLMKIAKIQVFFGILTSSSPSSFFSPPTQRLLPFHTSVPYSLYSPTPVITTTTVTNTTQVISTETGTETNTNTETEAIAE
jgi:hypothetical protein